MNTQEIIKRAQEVLNIEAKEIQKVSSDISEDFVKAVFEILNCKGRVVLSGIGKSGHIAGKIASTFASTGTPAFFMHPGEASHGDLGMITEDDIVIFLSNSGQSNELVSILPTIKRIGAKIISITGDSSSNLAKQSDIHISVKVTKEACPLGLAPTASSSASLALGDALAICVLDLREFTAEDFARSHPGGSLGKIVLVKDIMTTNLVLFTIEQSIHEVMNAFIKNKISGVVNSVGKPLGIFTDGDLRRSMLDGIEINSSIDKSMKKNPIILKSDQMAVEALKMMEEMKITAFLVTDANNFLIGALTIQNLFKAKII